ncbi:hypothetical protein M2318_004188 [Metapseudomonas resinovorans]|uniref:hypothetical protein n=1 Tax=Metapseudomonas resinovorans TaxID=53412 RepID=UPI003D23D433
MKSAPKMPTAKNIPDLLGNIEGLKRYSFLCVLLPEPSLSQDDRRLRAWLLHTVASASRHYTRARELVELQDNSDQERDGGVVFHILDVSEQIEDCITATFRACMAIKRIHTLPEAQDFSTNYQKPFEDLRAIRNQFDHMHTQITSGEIGNGPISMAFSNEGRSIQFRKLSMETTNLRMLIDGAYKVVASMYPNFNPSSPKEAGGPIKISMSATITVTDADGNIK